MLHRLLPLGALALALPACQSSPKQTVLDLDTTDPLWTSAACVEARKKVHDYNDQGMVRSAAGVAGAAAAGPVVGAAANVALSATQDDEREDLNNAVKRACVSRRGVRADGGALPADPPPLAIPPAADGPTEPAPQE